MSKLKTFSFENQSVRTLGSSDFPLFVAVDVIHALGFKDTINPIKRHIDPEDLIKSEITDKLGRKQTVNCVNESGLFALILGSKLKSAKRFKRWVTSEVLPEIRKTGRYELPRETISTEQQYLLRKAVERRCKNDSLHFQRVYHELYDRFKIPSYRDLLKSDFEEAMAFLEAEDLLPGGSDVVATETPPKGGIYLTADETQTVANCVYLYRYLFRDRFFVIFQVLKTLNSPLSAELYEAFNNLSMIQLEHSLEKKGVKVPKPQQNLIM